MFSLCSLCRPEREEAAPPLKAAGGAPPTGAPVPQSLCRSQSETTRIIKVQTELSSQFLRSQSMPAGPLLEAAMRRAAAAAAREAAEAAAQQASNDGAVALQFVQRYMQVRGPDGAGRLGQV